MTEKTKLQTWDDKIQKAKEDVKESFWGDFLFGGLLVSGMFIFIESFELSQYASRIIGLVLFIIAIFLVFSRFLYFKLRTKFIEMVIKKAENYRYELKYEESLALLNKLLKNNSNLRIKEIWNNKGTALYLLDRNEEALESFNYALDIDPYYKFANIGKSRIFYKLKRFEEALESYDKVLAIDENYGEAWYDKATIESLRNNKEKALDYLSKAVIFGGPNYAEMAKSDRDFHNVRDSEEFKEITELYD